MPNYNIISNWNNTFEYTVDLLKVIYPLHSRSEGKMGSIEDTIQSWYEGFKYDAHKLRNWFWIILRSALPSMILKTHIHTLRGHNSVIFVKSKQNYTWL